MAGIGGFTIEYTDGGGTNHVLKKYCGFTGDATTFLAGSGTTIDLAAATPHSPIANAGILIRAHCKVLEAILPTGSNIVHVGADFRATGGPATVDATAFYLLSGFAPLGGEALHGPDKIGFVKFNGQGAASKRAGWLRYYTSAKAVWDLQRNQTPFDVNTQFSGYIIDISGEPSGAFTGYAVWSGATTPGGAWESVGPYNVAHFGLGARNG